MRTGPLSANRVGGTREAAVRRQGTAMAVRATARRACRRTARRRPTGEETSSYQFLSLGVFMSRDAQAARPACDAWSRAAWAGGLGRSYFACPRRAAISSSLVMEE